METTIKKRILFIVNPISGIHKKTNFPKLVENIIDHEKFDTEIIFTQYARHATEIAQDAVIKKYDIVVACGGDGTVNQVSSCLIDTDVILGIIPFGSGNGLARHLHFSLKPENALEAINSGIPTKIDTATINGQPFVSIAGIGFDAYVARKYASVIHRGFFSYLKIIAKSFTTYRQKKYTLILNNEETISTNALFISFANSNQFGYNATIAPKANLADGFLDVCIVKKPILFEIPVLANLLLLKMVHLSRYVKIIKASDIKVVNLKNKYVNLDGEPLKIKGDLHIYVKPLSLNILIKE